MPVVIVSRAKLAKIRGVSVRTIRRWVEALNLEWTGAPPTPPGKIAVHDLPGRGGLIGYELAEAMPVFDAIENSRPAMRNAARWVGEQRKASSRAAESSHAEAFQD